MCAQTKCHLRPGPVWRVAVGKERAQAREFNLFLPVPLSSYGPLGMSPILGASASSPVKQNCSKRSWLFQKRIFTHLPSLATAFILLHPPTGGLNQEHQKSLWWGSTHTWLLLFVLTVHAQFLELISTSLAGSAWPQPLPSSVSFPPASPKTWAERRAEPLQASTWHSALISVS